MNLNNVEKKLLGIAVLALVIGAVVFILKNKKEQNFKTQLYKKIDELGVRSQIIRFFDTHNKLPTSQEDFNQFVMMDLEWEFGYLLELNYSFSYNADSTRFVMYEFGFDNNDNHGKIFFNGNEERLFLYYWNKDYVISSLDLNERGEPSTYWSQKEDDIIEKQNDLKIFVRNYNRDNRINSQASTSLQLRGDLRN